MKGTHVNRLTRTGTHVRRHGVTLGGSIFRQRLENVPATPSPEKDAPNLR